MSDEVLNIELTGKTDAIPLESFLEVISNTLAILKDIDADLADEATATLDWQIVGASLNSPMLLTIAGLALFGIGDGGEVISAYLKGLDGIEQGITERPAHFTEQAVRKTANLLGVLRGDLKRVKFSSNAETGIQPITPTAKALETVSVILEQHAEGSPENTDSLARVVNIRAYPSNSVEEKATLIGTLEMLSVHGKNPRFVIYDPLTGKEISWFFPESRYEEVKAALPKSTNAPYRVEVTGKAKFNQKGQPTSITVEHFRRLRDRTELPSFRNLEGINFTGSLDPTEYVRRLILLCQIKNCLRRTMSFCLTRCL